MFRFLGLHGNRSLRERFEQLVFREPYLVAVGPRAAWGDHLQGRALKVIRSPRGRYYADPFLVRAGDSHYLFVEDADVHTGEGVITCMPISGDGSAGHPEVVLKRDYHLSYPFVFNWMGDTYMIPETERNRSIELYRAAAFPRGWELVKVLFRDVHAVDSTLFEYGGRFWLFTAMSQRSGSLNDELFLFYSDSPLGEWIPHPNNPVVSDASRARSAGAVYVERGEIIRPGQDCSRIYGEAISLNRIEVLSESDYRERPVDRIEPDWYPRLLGTHTINFTDRLVVVDGYHVVPRWRA